LTDHIKVVRDRSETEERGSESKRRVHPEVRGKCACLADLEIHYVWGHLQRPYLHCLPRSCYGGLTSLSIAAVPWAMTLVARSLDLPLLVSMCVKVIEVVD
jgi:hypothetical protein